jgi:hypothetical protein
LNSEAKDEEKKLKGKRSTKKSEGSTVKRGTKRSRAKDLDDEEFTCSYLDEESTHSSSTLDKGKLKKRAKLARAPDPFDFTDMPTYDSLDGTDSMTCTPMRRDSASEDTLGEILASTCGTPIDDSSAWTQIACNADNFSHPIEEGFSEANRVSCIVPSESNQPGLAQDFFSEMATSVSFIDDAFDENIFSY